MSDKSLNYTTHHISTKTIYPSNAPLPPHTTPPHTSQPHLFHISTLRLRNPIPLAIIPLIRPAILRWCPSRWRILLSPILLLSIPRIGVIPRVVGGCTHWCRMLH